MTSSDEPVERRTLEGQRVGPYELGSRIAAGGMGEVYKARDTRLDRTVAIKVLHAHAANNPQARDRFDREARAVAALNHPHICTLYDVGYQSGLDFLVMEYLDGETLAARLAKGPLLLAEAVQLAVQIVSGLDRAHRAGIVHRDLKPGNIFLVRSHEASVPPTAKLLDFGLAKAFTPDIAGSASGVTRAADLTTPGLILGTVQYMAPEQIEGRPTDARTDLFAFGAVLHEMLTGSKAFVGTTSRASWLPFLSASLWPWGLCFPLRRRHSLASSRDAWRRIRTSDGKAPPICRASSSGSRG